MSINANKRSLDDANAEFFSDEWFAANADEIDDILKQAEKKPRMMVQTRCEIQIISGGQTGADRAALEAAADVGFKTGGTAPRGFMTSGGPDLTLKTKFGLKECASGSIAQMYVRRSMLNVDDSDGTIAFRLCASVGTDKTIGYARSRKWAVWRGDLHTTDTRYKPCLVIDSVGDIAAAAEKIVCFCRKLQPRVLNVCGHRGDHSAKCSGFTASVRKIMAAALRELAGK